MCPVCKLDSQWFHWRQSAMLVGLNFKLRFLRRWSAKHEIKMNPFHYLDFSTLWRTVKTLSFNSRFGFFIWLYWILNECEQICTDESFPRDQHDNEGSSHISELHWNSFDWYSNMATMTSSDNTLYILLLIKWSLTILPPAESGLQIAKLRCILTYRIFFQNY